MNKGTDIFEKTDESKQALLRAIIESSDDIIISKTLEGIITSWNPAAENIFGYTEDEAIGSHITMIIPRDRLYEEDYIISEITKGNKIHQFETIRVTKDGRSIPVSLSVSPIKDNNGVIIGATKIARDITERKKAEEKQARLAAIISSSDDAIISKTVQGIITSWNTSAEKMFGYKEEEAIGKHISLIIPKERLKEEEYIINQIISGNKVDHFETMRVHKEGWQIPISLTVSPIKDSTGKIIGASKIARDISLQKAAQEMTLRYTRSLEVINSVGTIILKELDQKNILQSVIDATTQVTDAQYGAFFYNTVNSRGKPFVLYTLSDTNGKVSTNQDFHFDHSIFSGQEVIRIDDTTKNDTRNNHNLFQSGILKENVEVRSYLAVPVVSKSGAVIGGLFFGHQEARKFTDEHARIVLSIASLAAVGLENAKLYQDVKSLNDKKDEFIGMASHELRTPLASMIGYLQIVHRLQNNESNKNFLDKSIQQGKKLSNLISDLLDISKIEAGKLQFSRVMFDIRTIIENAVELIQHSNTSHQIIFQAQHASVMIQGDPQRIEQVVINLLSNAIKYSPHANKVEVLLFDDAKEIKIGVRDSGIGIPPDKHDLIFSRFYRVEDFNSAISGLGIGLYISREIINRHNGKIWVESEVGKGSTFWVTVPRL